MYSLLSRNPIAIGLKIKILRECDYEFSILDT